MKEGSFCKVVPEGQSGDRVWSWSLGVAHFWRCSRSFVDPMHGTSVQASDRISAGARLQSLAESRMMDNSVYARLAAASLHSFFSFLLHVPASFGYLNFRLRVRSLAVLWYLFFFSLFQPIISALHASGFKKTVQRQVLVLFQVPSVREGRGFCSRESDGHAVHLRQQQLCI